MPRDGCPLGFMGIGRMVQDMGGAWGFSPHPPPFSHAGEKGVVNKARGCSNFQSSLRRPGAPRDGGVLRDFHHGAGAGWW